jgi:hypothetical protein
VVAVGAHSYDHWFGWAPSRDREAFCAAVGLDPALPIVLYLCSSKFIAAYEPPFVERWLRALRARTPANVLVRPHPASGAHWAESDLGGRDRVAVWPPAGENPISDAAKADYFDSIFHSAVVVGLNTSALIESAIVGRPAFTVLDPEFAGSQEGTLHFHHLLRDRGGPLTVARSMDEHVAHVAAALEQPPPEGWSRPFVASFVRPHGLDAPATPRLVAELEALAARPAPAPAARPLADRALSAALTPLAAALTWYDARGRKAFKRARKRLRKRWRRARLAL